MRGSCLNLRLRVILSVDKMPKKSLFSVTHVKPSLYPHVNEMVEHFPIFHPESNEYTMMLKKTMISPSICLITLYGGDVEVYTTEVLMFRANDPKAAELYDKVSIIKQCVDEVIEIIHEFEIIADTNIS